MPLIYLCDLLLNCESFVQPWQRYKPCKTVYILVKQAIWLTIIKNKLSREGKDVFNTDHTEPLNRVGMCRTYIIRVGFHYQLLKVAHWEPCRLLPNKALPGSLFSECQVCRVNALQWLIVLPSARQSSIPLSHGLRVLSDLIGSSQWTNRTVSNLWKSTWQILPVH